MTRTLARRLVRLAILVAAFHFSAIEGVANGGLPATATSLSVKAHFETRPDYIEMSPPCTSWTSVPKAGSCSGLGRSTGQEKVTGDMQGKVDYVYGFVILPSGLTYSGGVDHFVGTIKNCGSGALVYQLAITSDRKGNFQAHWQIVQSEGGLVGVTGGGTVSGATRADGSTFGEYTGTIHCSK